MLQLGTNTNRIIEAISLRCVSNTSAGKVERGAASERGNAIDIRGHGATPRKSEFITCM
jgi:hypothetical protein